MSPPDPDAALAADTVAASRPASLWPDSTRAGLAGSTSFALSRFDPLAEQGRRLDNLGLASFDVCHPALALRAVLLVQLALALVALAASSSPAQWLMQQAALALGGVAATGLWLLLVCALKRPLQGLAANGQLMAYEHHGFWQPMDTLRDKHLLEELWASGKAPWKTWD